MLSWCVSITSTGLCLKSRFSSSQELARTLLQTMDDELFLEQVVHLLSWTACFAWLLKINIDWSRNLLPVSVRSRAVLLQQCPIEHNLSIIAFPPPAFALFFGSELFLLPSVLRAQQRCYICAAHCGQSWSPRAKERTYISLDCVSGRLLDKDHNMTLFLFCAGSVNRRKASAAQHAPVQDIDHRSQT